MSKVEETLNNTPDNKSEKIVFDDLDSFRAHLRKENKDDTDIEIIICVAKHKSGIHISNAHSYIESFLERNDRNIISNKLTLLGNEKKYIYLDSNDDTNTYKFNYGQYDIKDISYVVEKPIEDYEVAVGAKARKSLKETMQDTQSCVYLFMAVTPVDYFEELLDYRIEKGRNTVVFFPHKKCVNINANPSYEQDFNTWEQYLNKHKGTDFFKFYLINNKEYTHLYSSCLTENIIRFNYFEYRKDGKIRTGGGRVHVGEKNTSFYDMIMKEYEKSFYERIPKWTKYTWKEYIKSLFRRHLIKSLIFTFVIFAIVSYLVLELFNPNLSSIVSSTFVLFTMIIGFLQGRINDNLRRKKLKF